MADKKRLIDANALIEEAVKAKIRMPHDKAVVFDLIEKAPTVDAVSRGVHDQVRWERYIAIEQLEEHGISFGCTAPDVVKVVRCKDCKHGIWDEAEQMWECVLDVDLDGDPDTYAMFHEYNDGDHFCSYGERKDNERKVD